MGEVETMLFLLSPVPDCLDSQLALTVGVGWVLVTPIPAANSGVVQCSATTALENRALERGFVGKQPKTTFTLSCFCSKATYLYHRNLYSAIKLLISVCVWINHFIDRLPVSESDL